MSTEPTVQKQFPERKYKEETRAMFDRGAIWMGKNKETGEVYFSRIEITLNPGTYVIEPGDSILFSAFPNNRKTDAEIDQRKPDYNIRLKKPKVEAPKEQ